MNLICYHGSPGLPQEFDQIGSLLKKNFQNIVSQPRKGYPSYKNSEFKMDGLRLGYSWGSIDSMRDTLSENTRGLLLIAPYLFQRQRLGILKKIALMTPILGTTLINQAAPLIIDQFLHKSCDPLPVPEELKKSKNLFKDPRVLKTAALEKDFTHKKIIQMLNQIKNHRIPVGIVFGSEDKTSTVSEQITPIQNILKPNFEHVIQGAGHAIPWTHSKELAKAVLKFKETL